MEMVGGGGDDVWGVFDDVVWRAEVGQPRSVGWVMGDADGSDWVMGGDAGSESMPRRGGVWENRSPLDSLLRPERSTNSESALNMPRVTCVERGPMTRLPEVNSNDCLV